MSDEVIIQGYFMITRRRRLNLSVFVRGLWGVTADKVGFFGRQAIRRRTDAAPVCVFGVSGGVLQLAWTWFQDFFYPFEMRCNIFHAVCTCCRHCCLWFGFVAKSI